jgi:hypothetical protein
MRSSNIARYLQRGLVTLAFFFPFVVFAQNKLVNPTPRYGTMYDFIMALLEIVLLIGLPMIVIAIIYAGFLLATAGGDEKKAESGKMVIVWTIVGGMIILGAKVIAELIRGTLSLF